MPADAPAVTLRPPARGRDGQRRRSAASSVWRFRSYLTPYRWRFAVMITLAGLGVAASIAVPLLYTAATWLVFERWFLVPLLKGPVEVWLGLA